MNKLFISLFALSLNLHTTTFAFTLAYSESVEGWNDGTLTFLVNYTDCLISKDELNNSIDSAMNLWNSAPTSSIRLVRGESTTATGSSPRDSKGPVIACLSNFSTVADSDSVAGVGYSAPEGEGLRLNYGYLIINGDSDGAANISALTTDQRDVLLAHELGHVLGLGHTEDQRSIMYYNISDKTRLTLSQDDIDGISYLYPRYEIGQDGLFGCGTIEKINPQRPSQNQFLLYLFWMSTLILLYYLQRKSLFTKAE